MADPLTTPPVPPREARRSIGALLADLPRIIAELIQAEIESLKAEVSSKLKSAGIGAGLLVGAGVFAFLDQLQDPCLGGRIDQRAETGFLVIPQTRTDLGDFTHQFVDPLLGLADKNSH